jgi:hypothetical protein
MTEITEEAITFMVTNGFLKVAEGKAALKEKYRRLRKHANVEYWNMDMERTV